MNHQRACLANDKLIFFCWTSKLKFMLEIGLCRCIYPNLRALQFFDFCLHFLSDGCSNTRQIFMQIIKICFCVKIVCSLMLAEEEKKQIHWSESAIFRWCLNIQIEVKFEMKWIFWLWKGKVNFSREKKKKKTFTLNGETVEVIIWTF